MIRVRQYIYLVWIFWNWGVLFVIFVIDVIVDVVIFVFVQLLWIPCVLLYRQMHFVGKR